MGSDGRWGVAGALGALAAIGIVRGRSGRSGRGSAVRLGSGVRLGPLLPGPPASTVTIRYIHKIAPSDTDVEGPYPITRADLVDLASVRRWWKKRTGGGLLGRVSAWRREPGKFLIFNPSEFRTWHAMILESPLVVLSPDEPRGDRIP